MPSNSKIYLTILLNCIVKFYPLSKTLTMLSKKHRVPVNRLLNPLIPAIKVIAVLKVKAKENIGRKIEVQDTEKGQNLQREVERSTRDHEKRREEAENKIGRKKEANLNLQEIGRKREIQGAEKRKKIGVKKKKEERNKKKNKNKGKRGKKGKKR